MGGNVPRTNDLLGDNPVGKSPPFLPRRGAVWENERYARMVAHKKASLTRRLFFQPTTNACHLNTKRARSTDLARSLSAPSQSPLFHHLPLPLPPDQQYNYLTSIKTLSGATHATPNPKTAWLPIPHPTLDRIHLSIPNRPHHRPQPHPHRW